MTAALPFAYPLYYYLSSQTSSLFYYLCRKEAEGGRVELPLPRIKRSCALTIKLTPKD